MVVAVDGPALATKSVYVIVWPAKYGAAVVSVLTIDTSADGAAEPPLPVLSVLLAGTGSGSVAETLATLSNEPVAVIVAVTVMVVFAFTPRLEIVHGNAAHAPVTLVMLRFDGVSVTWMLVAGDGPALLINSV